MNRKLIAFSQFMGVDLITWMIPPIAPLVFLCVWAFCGTKYAIAFGLWRVSLVAPQLVSIITFQVKATQVIVPATIHYAATHSTTTEGSTASKFIHWLFALPGWERLLISYTIEVTPFLALGIFLLGFYLIMKDFRERLKKAIQPYLRFQL